MGYELALHWQLPDSISNAIRWHHSPELAEEGLLEVALIHIAAVMADCMVWDDDINCMAERISSHAWQITGLDLTACREAEGEVGGEIRELFGILMGHSSNA